MTHSEKFKQPFNKQIITKKSRERYVIDITELNDDINDKKYNYKYILNVIDHYSKFCSSYLLESKKAEEIIICLNDFISHFGSPKHFQCDNGGEFKNDKFEDFCHSHKIHIIHSKPRHPQTNRIVERLHTEIKKTLFIEKLSKKDNYNIKMAISNAIYAHNYTISRTTKFKPIELFNNNS